MNRYKVREPDSNSYINRKWCMCPVCTKYFMAGAAGYMISLMHDEYNEYKGVRYVCSDTCANFFILSDMMSGTDNI